MKSINIEISALTDPCVAFIIPHYSPQKRYCICRAEGLKRFGLVRVSQIERPVFNCATYCIDIYRVVVNILPLLFALLAVIIYSFNDSSTLLVDVSSHPFPSEMERTPRIPKYQSSHRLQVCLNLRVSRGVTFLLYHQDRWYSQWFLGG